MVALTDRPNGPNNIFPTPVDELLVPSDAKLIRDLGLISKKMSLLRGQRVFSRSEVAKQVFIHRTGTAVIRHYAVVEDAFLSAKPERIYGLSEVLADEEYSFDFNAVTPCTFEVINEIDLIGMIRRKPDFGIELAICLADLFDRSVRKLFEICRDLPDVD